MPSTIYNAVHLADDLTSLEDNSFNMEMTQDAVSDCQSCLNQDAEIKLLKEKVDKLQYLGNLSLIIIISVYGVRQHNIIDLLCINSYFLTLIVISLNLI